MKFFSILKKVDVAITNVFFSKLWTLVDLMVLLNIIMFCFNYNLSIDDTYNGIGIIIYLICFIYFIICDQIRLDYRLSVLEKFKRGEDNEV